MAKQLYKGPPTGMLPLTMDGVGWRYGTSKANSEHPSYTLWVTPQDDSMYGDYPTKRISLWWNGARWVAWVHNLFTSEPTEFTDINDPPIDWAEGVYTLANN